MRDIPASPPATGVPYTREQILAYWQLCDDMIDPGVDKLDLLSSDSGFSWYRVSKLEFQVINIRHIQHHAAQLAERLRAATDTRIEWVCAKNR